MNDAEIRLKKVRELLAMSRRAIKHAEDNWNGCLCSDEEDSRAAFFLDEIDKAANSRVERRVPPAPEGDPDDL